MAGEIPGSGTTGPIDPQKSSKSPTPKSVSESKMGERVVTKGIESPEAEASESKAVDVANKSLEAADFRELGAFVPAGNLLATCSKAVFLFQRTIALESLGRTGVAGGDLRGRVQKLQVELESTPKVKAVWAKNVQQPGKKRAEGALANFSKEMVAILGKEHPEMRARVPKDPYATKLGVIIVSNETVIPKDAPGILMTEDQYKEKVDFIQDNITLCSDDSPEDHDFVIGMITEILTWDRGPDFLQKCTEKTGRLPLIQTGVEWCSFLGDSHVEFNREQDLTEIPFRTADGKPFQGDLSGAVCLVHELWHSMDPLLKKGEERFVDDIMYSAWNNPAELRAVTVANLFRQDLFLGTRSSYFKGVNFPISPETRKRGERLLADRTTELNHDAISKRVRYLAIKKALLGDDDFSMPSDITREELEGAIASLTPEERESVQSLNMNGNFVIKSLPHNLDLLPNLTQISATNCSSLVSIPTSIGTLQKLETLNLNHCRRLTKLPNSIGLLQNLTRISCLDCIYLNSIPASIGKLQRLETLNLNCCYRLENLPVEIGKLSKLRYLDLEDCRFLEGVLLDIRSLPELNNLKLSGCMNLKDVPYQLQRNYISREQVEGFFASLPSS